MNASLLLLPVEPLLALRFPFHQGQIIRSHFVVDFFHNFGLQLRPLALKPVPFRLQRLIQWGFPRLTRLSEVLLRPPVRLLNRFQRLFLLKSLLLLLERPLELGMQFLGADSFLFLALGADVPLSAVEKRTECIISRLHHSNLPTFSWTLPSDAASTARGPRWSSIVLLKGFSTVVPGPPPGHAPARLSVSFPS